MSWTQQPPDSVSWDKDVDLVYLLQENGDKLLEDSGSLLLESARNHTWAGQNPDSGSWSQSNPTPTTWQT